MSLILGGLLQMGNNSIFLDMDGVLTDFVKSALARTGLMAVPYKDTQSYNWYNQYMSSNAFWGQLEGADFWAELEPLPWALPLIDAVERYDPEYMICTSCSLDPACPSGKMLWLRDHLGLSPKRTVMLNNKSLLAAPDRVLIDDTPIKVSNWVKAGGRATLLVHPEYSLNYAYDQLTCSKRDVTIAHPKELIEQINSYNQFNGN